MQSFRFLVCLIVFAAPLSALAQRTDFSGVWTLDSNFQRNPESQWSASTLPFTPEGRERFDTNVPGKGPRAEMPALGNDPLGQANPPGLYRTLGYDLSRPWEFVQLDNKVIQFFEWGKHWRTIWTDGRELPEVNLAGPFWYGYSVGEWQGDTLVVRTNSLDGRAWMDGWGTPLTDSTVVEERWTRSGDKIQLTVTVTDPVLYTETWTGAPITYALQSPDSPDGEPLEQIFAPIDEVEFNNRIRDRLTTEGSFR